MALSTPTNKAQLSRSVGTGPYDLAVRILDEDDVKVFVKTIATGAEVELAKTTGFTIAAISADYDNGARVTTVATYTSAEEITLLRTVDNDQGLDLVTGGDLSSSALEDALDKGVMQNQQLNEILDRTITAPATDVSGLSYDIGSVVDRADKVLGFNSAGSVTQVSLAASGTIGVDTDAGLSIASNIISINADETSISFDAGNGKLEVKALGIDTAELATLSVETAKINTDAVTTAKILDSNVTYAKIQDVSATAKLLGRTTASAGVVEEVPLLLSTDGASASETSVMTEKRAKAYTDAHGIIQITSNFYSAAATGTTVLPYDDTIPQITEGDQFMTKAITPTSATTTLRIDVIVNVAHSTSDPKMSIALFQDATTDALAAAASCIGDDTNDSRQITLSHIMTSGTTSTTTFRVRVGADSAGTTTFNGHSAGRIFGGVMSSSIIITEIKT